MFWEIKSINMLMLRIINNKLKYLQFLYTGYLYKFIVINFKLEYIKFIKGNYCFDCLIYGANCLNTKLYI